jgi:hypothetical protein
LASGDEHLEMGPRLEYRKPPVERVQLREGPLVASPRKRGGDLGSGPARDAEGTVAQLQPLFVECQELVDARVRRRRNRSVGRGRIVRSGMGRSVASDVRKSASGLSGRGNVKPMVGVIVGSR